MRYFVIADDGEKYGPADVSLLNHWIEEGRLLPGMMLEEDGTHHKVAAASVTELDFYRLDGPPTPHEPGHVAVMPSYEATPAESERADLFLSWSMVAVTLFLAAVRPVWGFLGIFTALLGVIAGIKCREKGHQVATPAIMINLLALIIWVAARVVMSLS